MFQLNGKFYFLSLFCETQTTDLLCFPWQPQRAQCLQTFIILFCIACCCSLLVFAQLYLGNHHLCVKLLSHSDLAGR